MKKAQPWLAAILLGIAVLIFGRLYFKATEETGQALDARQQALQTLGAYLAGLDGVECVQVLSNPFTQQSGQAREIHRFENAGIRGLETGLGDAINARIVFPTVKPEYRDNPQSAVMPQDIKTPLSFLIDPGSVDQLAKDAPDCGLFVSLIGLPAGVTQLGVWKPNHTARFALLLPDLRVVGTKAKAAQAFKSGKIVAAVVNDPNSAEPILITADNIDQILKDNPNLLGFRRSR